MSRILKNLLRSTSAQPAASNDLCSDGWHTTMCGRCGACAEQVCTTCGHCTTTGCANACCC